MPHRNVLSLFRRVSLAALGASTLLLAPVAQADEEKPSLLLSLLMPSLVEPAANPVESALTIHEIPVVPQPPRTIDLTAAPDNLWERIRNGFAMTNLNDDLVLHYQLWYQNRPDALRRMVERSRPFLHHIVEELESRGMPTELALLPMVESSYNPMAYSRAHASGLWQFIPATGKRFNLEQNWWQDQRRDIVASTGAALDYLQTIYDMHGDWHLALASYNWGEGAVKRAVDKNTARGLPTDYASLTMPNETRHYVPKLQALKNIFGNPALVAQLDLPQVSNSPYFARLETARPMDVKTAARLANMSLEEFQRLNPAHNRPIIKPDSTVVIPADKLATFQQNLEEHRAPLSSWQGYTVTASERLESIAAHFGISTSELARVNGLSEKARLGAGSTLLVPGGGNTENLGHLLNASAPTHIIEPEPTARTCGKSAKRAAQRCTAPAGKMAKGNEKSPTPKENLAKSGKTNSKVASNSDRKPASAKAAGATKTASSAKSAPAPKQAKPGNTAPKLYARK
nr:transglycosylase SLT domain-containing protein [Dechloromonas sp.]